MYPSGGGGCVWPRCVSGGCSVAAVQGGHKLLAALRQASKASGVHSVDVGFFDTARYPDGTPVAAVAAWNEFGTERKGFHRNLRQRVPERPFFRQALYIANSHVPDIVRRGIDSKTLEVTPSLAEEVGLYVQGEVQQRITDLRHPPNRPITIHGGWLGKPGKGLYIKGKGSSNPLIDTGTMRTAVTFMVHRSAPVGAEAA